MYQLFPGFTRVYSQVMKALVTGLAVLAGASILAMVGLPCVDIILRKTINKPIPGVYDLVRITGLLAVSFGLPYTTAVKGHVAIEFLYQRLKGAGRIIFELAIQAVCLVLFACLAWICIQKGNSDLASGVQLPTSQIPIFWMYYVIAFNSLIMLFVFLDNFLNGGKP